MIDSNAKLRSIQMPFCRLHAVVLFITGLLSYKEGLFPV